MRIESLILGVLVFAAVIAGYSLFYDDMDLETNITISDYGAQDLAESKGNESETEAGDITTQESSIGIWLFRAPVRLVSTIGRALGSFRTILRESMLDRHGIPPVFVDLAATGIGIIGAFAILRAIWGEQKL